MAGWVPWVPLESSIGASWMTSNLTAWEGWGKEDWGEAQWGWCHPYPCQGPEPPLQWPWPWPPPPLLWPADHPVWKSPGLYLQQEEDWGEEDQGWLNEDGATRTLVKGLYLLCNGLNLLLLYYGQMTILHGNLLDCIRLNKKRRIKNMEEIIEDLSHLVNVPHLDNDLLFDSMGLLVKGLGLLLNGHMVLLGRLQLQDNWNWMNETVHAFACTSPPSCTSPPRWWWCARKYQEPVCILWYTRLDQTCALYLQGLGRAW